MNSHKTLKFMKFFSLESFPLYGICGLYSMYRSLQYVIFTPCNVLLEEEGRGGGGEEEEGRRRRGNRILYCSDDWRVKDGVVHRSRQQSPVAKWLELGVYS